MNVKKQFMDGLIHQNPVTVQLLGMCSVLAITTTMFNGISHPAIVLATMSGDCKYLRQYTYDDYKSRMS